MQCQGPTCTREIEQIPGSHRQRIYCSDRCRMAARRLRIRGAEQALIQQVEARTRKEREKVAHRFGLLTEASLDLLVELGHRDPKFARVVQALARERNQALANQKRAEQERSMQAAKVRRLGAELGYPAVDALDLSEGEDHWRTYLVNPKHPLEPLFA
jgi:metal-dependent amidase/aminoacylase/carboxypeptidase family protein